MAKNRESKQNYEQANKRAYSQEPLSETFEITTNLVNILGLDIINLVRYAKVEELVKDVKGNELAWKKSVSYLADINQQERINNWFQNELDDIHQRLFVSTLALFNGIKYADFEEIFEIVLEIIDTNTDSNKIVLGIDGSIPNSVFSHSELIEKSRAEIFRESIEQDEILKFKHPEYEVGVLQCLKDNYSNILVALLPALKKIGESSQSEIRSRAAAAAAEIGAMDFNLVNSQVLMPWAYNERAYVRATASYAWAKLFINNQGIRPAIYKLFSWFAQDKSPQKTDLEWRLIWASALAYGYIGLTESEIAYTGLKQIATHNDIRVTDAVIRTLVILSLREKLESIICLLGDWIADVTSAEYPTVSMTAITAFIALANIHRESFEENDKSVNAQSDSLVGEVGNLFELVRKSAADDGKIWETVIMWGIRTLEYGLGDLFFSIIEIWTRIASKDKYSQRVIDNLLKEIYKNIPRPTNGYIVLRNYINNWRRLQHVIEPDTTHSVQFSEEPSSKLAGDSTTDAPPPKNKKVKLKGK